MGTIKQKVDDSARFYSESFLNVDYQLAEFGFDSLKPYFKGKLALELGPASGYMTKSLVHKFETLHIVEGSGHLLSQIPDYNNVVKFHSLFENYETDMQYDTIIMSHVLEHIAEPVKVLSQIYNWLDKEGVFLVAVPNAKSIHRLAAVEMGFLSSEYELNQRDYDLGHYRVYDTQTLKADLLAAGFKIKYSGGYFLKPISNSQIESHWSQEMISGFYKVGKYFQENCAEIFAVCTK